MQWWRFYGDSTLCRIIERTLDNNRDMLAAAARVERLRELYRVSRANACRRSREPLTATTRPTTTPVKNRAATPDSGPKSRSAGSWICGATCAGPNAKGAPEYLASVEDRRAMRMMLVASVAAAYFNLIALDNELSIVRRTLITRSEGLYQVQLRFRGAVSPPKWSISRRRWSTPRRPR